jgi:hypothetical protein
MLMISCPWYGATTYQIVTPSDGRCGSYAPGSGWVILGERVGQRRDGLLEQVKDHPLNGPPHRPRQRVDLLPGAPSWLCGSITVARSQRSFGFAWTPTTSTSRSMPWKSSGLAVYSGS